MKFYDDTFPPIWYMSNHLKQTVDSPIVKHLDGQFELRPVLKPNATESIVEIAGCKSGEYCGLIRLDVAAFQIVVNQTSHMRSSIVMGN